MDEDALRAHIAAEVAAGREVQADLAGLIKIDPTAFSKWMHRKRRLKASEADTLRRYFGQKQATANEDTHMLPILGKVPAGRWQESLEDVHGYIPSPDKRLSRSSFVLVVEGGSMNKRVQDGDSIIVDPEDKELRAGGLYVVRNAHGDTTFKQYLEGPARLEPATDEDGHNTIYPGQEIFTIVGRVRKRIEDL